MAELGSWESIRDHGLRSTSALLDLFEIDEPARSEIEGSRRPELVLLEHPAYGEAAIRDNKPLRHDVLVSRLDGCTAEEFYRLLNGRVFFWPTENRLVTLLGARAYRDRAHTVVTIDTAELLDRYEPQVTLSRINSGATLFDAPRRGPATFETIAHFAERDNQGRPRAVAEVAVEYAIFDIADIAVAVQNRYPDGTIEEVWQR
jgi:hypothetical protein